MTKLSDLSALTGASVDAANDLIHAADMSETGVARSKKMTFAELKVAVGAYSPGGTDVALADGGTGASTAAAARTNLDVYSTSEVDALVGGSGSGVAVEEDGASEGTGITTLNFSTGLDVSVAGSEATITASGGGGGGSLWWFDPPAAADFSTLQSADATNITVSDDADAGCVFNYGALTTGPIGRFAFKAISAPSSDWSVEFKMRVTVPPDGGINCEAGFWLRDTTSGKLIGLAQRDNGNFVFDRPNGLTWGGSELAGYFGGMANGLGTLIMPNVFWRITYTASDTSYRVYHSMVGKADTWRKIATHTVAAHLGDVADLIGFGALCNRVAEADADLTVHVERWVQSW